MKFRGLEVPGTWELEVQETWELEVPGTWELRNLGTSELEVPGTWELRNLGTWELTLGCPNMLKVYVPPYSINSSVGTTGINIAHQIILQVFLTLLKSRHSCITHSSQTERGDWCHAARPLSS